MDPKQIWKSLLIAAFFSAFVYVGYVVVFQGTLPPFPEFLAGLFGEA